jgi:RNA polymerase sigma factor (sigma-70 family)
LDWRWFAIAMGGEGTETPGGGGEADLAGLLRRLSPALEAILRRFRIPPDDADDVVQQALLQYVRKRSQVRAPEPWLRGALRNECRMYWRSRTRSLTVTVDQALLDVVAGSSEEPERAILRRSLGRWVALLPYNCRSLLRLRYTLELDVQEIAARSGYRPSSVDKVTRRCLEVLSRKMAAFAVSRESAP